MLNKKKGTERKGMERRQEAHLTKTTDYIFIHLYWYQIVGVVTISNCLIGVNFVYSSFFFGGGVMSYCELWMTMGIMKMSIHQVGKKKTKMNRNAKNRTVCKQYKKRFGNVFHFYIYSFRVTRPLSQCAFNNNNSSDDIDTRFENYVVHSCTCADYLWETEHWH